ncbi:MAG: hypothetical protein QOH39_1134 [Verrucomicrobiota bacterium]|jgi:hypothetical protein
MSNFAKWTVGIVGTVLLGALGSGFWDLFLRDIFVWIGHGLLTLITLGISSVRDSFYLEIAKGRTDRVGIYLVSFGMSFLGILTGFVFALATFRPGRAAGLGMAHFRAVRWVLILTLLFLSSVFWFRFISVAYTTSAVDHFEQAFAICLPYMSVVERDNVRSQFARVHTKEDYVSVLRTLEDRAQANKVELPKFAVW